jgi:hypothetical protein
LLTPHDIDKAEEEQKPDANSFKVYSFARAIHAVMNLNHPIRSGTDVVAVIDVITSIASQLLIQLISSLALV